MSAFDDEFGLFGDDDAPAEGEERKPTLGARRIASDEASHDDIEPEDERPRRGRRDRSADGGTGAVYGEGRRERRDYGDRGARKTEDPAVAQQRALGLLEFLAKKLVTHADEVLVEEVDTDRGRVVELVVVHEDLGKVIGRSGRVAQALRTLVRASAEGRLSIDIVSYEEDDEETDPSTSSGRASAQAADRDAGSADDESATGSEAAGASGEPAG